MNITDIQNRIETAIPLLTFEKLCKLSDGRDFSKIIEKCLKHNVLPDITDSRNQFVQYFQESLAAGSCTGQSLSCLQKNADPKLIKTMSHVHDSLVFQTLYELRFGMKQSLKVKTDTTTPPSSPRKKVLSRKVMPDMSTHVDNKKNIVAKKIKLIEQIEAIEKQVFSGFRLDKEFQEIGKTDISVKNKSPSYIEKKELQKVLVENSNMYIIGRPCRISDKDFDHTFCIIKSDDRFFIYDVAEENHHTLRTDKRVSRILRYVQDNLSSLYAENGLKKVKFQVYIKE